MVCADEIQWENALPTIQRSALIPGWLDLVSWLELVGWGWFVAGKNRGRQLASLDSFSEYIRSHL